jgi:hypothetical protein
MKYIKTFSLFENKTHSLVLPKDQSELNILRESTGFQILRNFTAGRHGCGLKMTQNGGVEIYGPVNYNFRVSPKGTFYYGGLKVGPKYNTNLDTWDKLFDYVYIYFLGTGLNIVSTDMLENFVFHGVIKSSLYTRIKGSEYYESILSLSRKYNGNLADQSVVKAIEESDKYINDPLKILETPSYKFFDTVFDFEPSIPTDRPYQLHVELKNLTPLGVFNKGEGLSLDSKIDVTLEGAPGASTFKTSVKTLKGLDKAFLNKIKELSGKNIRTWRMDEISIIKSNAAMQILKDIIAAYESGDSYTPDPLGMVKEKILEVLNNWDYNKIENFFEVVSGLLNDEDLRVIAEEYSNSESGKAKMRKMLLDLKNNNLLDYAKVGKEWGNNPIFADVFSDIMRDDANIIKGGSMIRRFGFGDKN